jgi:predicted ribonuclease YlaK
MFTSEDLKKILSRVGQHTKVVMMDSLDAPSDSEKK